MLGAHFAGVDLTRSPDGLGLIECHPSRTCAVFEYKSGLDVATPLAGYLLHSKAT